MRVRPLMIGSALVAIAYGCFQPGGAPPPGGGGGPVTSLSPYPSPTLAAASPFRPPADTPGVPVMLPPLGPSPEPSPLGSPTPVPFTP